MRIVRSKESEAWLVQAVKTWLEKQPRAEGIHVSDLLYPRKAYWKRIDPRPMTDADAGFFVAGQGHHFVIEAIVHGAVGKVKRTAGADEGSKQWEGIWYSKDLVAPKLIELKTSRAKDAPADLERAYLVEYKHYLEQLKSYMAIENEPESALVVFYLNLLDGKAGSTIPTFRWYDVSLSKMELQAQRKTLITLRDALKLAVKRKNPASLPACPKWMAFRCPWRDKCGCLGPPKKRVKV